MIIIVTFQDLQIKLNQKDCDLSANYHRFFCLCKIKANYCFHYYYYYLAFWISLINFGISFTCVLSSALVHRKQH